MATAMYLEHYLDSLESLPTELKRNFTLMADLDTRAQGPFCAIIRRQRLLNIGLNQPDCL